MVIYPLKGTALQSREMLDAHPKPFFFLFVFCDVFLSCAPLGARLGVHTPFVVSRWRDAPKQRCDPHRSVDHLILTSDIGWGPPKILLSKKLPGSDSRFRWLQ